MVYARKSPEEHITETQLVISEIENHNSKDELQSNANTVRLFNRQPKSNQIDQAMLSNSKLYRKYNNAKKKLRKLSPQQTPAIVTAAVDDSLESLKKSMSLEKDISEIEFILLEIEILHLMDDLQRDAKKLEC